MAGLGENLSNTEPQDICGPQGVPYFNERKIDVSEDDLGIIERNLDIPEGIRFHLSKITSETSRSQLELKASVLDNFIRSSINISSGSELLDSYMYNEVFALINAGVIESRGTLQNIEFPDYVVEDIFQKSLNLFLLEYPSEYIDFYNQKPHSIIFGDFTIDNNTLPLPEVVLLEEGKLIEEGDIMEENQLGDIKPVARPEGYDWELIMERGKNQFEKLRDEGFSPEMNDFITHNLFPYLCSELGIECNDVSVKNLQQLLLFIIDCETTQGTKLSNPNYPNVTGLAHIENDPADTRATGAYNTIDTMVRVVAMKWYDLDISGGGKIEDLGQEATWIRNLWERNGEVGVRGFEGRDGIEYTRDDQLRVILGRSSVYRVAAMQIILNPSSSREELRDAAIDIYGLNYGIPAGIIIQESDGTPVSINAHGKIDEYFPL